MDQQAQTRTHTIRAVVEGGCQGCDQIAELLPWQPEGFTRTLDLQLKSGEGRLELTGTVTDRQGQGREPSPAPESSPPQEPSPPQDQATASDLSVPVDPSAT